MAEEFVHVRPKGSSENVEPGYVTRTAFDDIWSKKGFEIVSESEVEQLAVANSPEPLPEAAPSGGDTETTAKKGR